MKHFKENDTVIYTDGEGNRFDTFVIFETDRLTGLTHINHLNLKVTDAELELHPRSLSDQIPMDDVYRNFRVNLHLRQVVCIYMHGGCL